MVFNGTRVFDCVEDTTHLRLTSELVDLRWGYANPILAKGKKLCENPQYCCQKKEKRPSKDGLFSLAAELGFEPRHTESESAVLPLHNSAIALTLVYSITKKFICQVLL